MVVQSPCIVETILRRLLSQNYFIESALNNSNIFRLQIIEHCNAQYVEIFNFENKEVAKVYFNTLRTTLRS